jgi:hypothetical protein
VCLYAQQFDEAFTYADWDKSGVPEKSKDPKNSPCHQDAHTLDTGAMEDEQAAHMQNPFCSACVPISQHFD